MTSLIIWQHNSGRKFITTKIKLAMVVVVSALTANVPTAMSVPVVPNFTQGSMTSTTETTSTVTETINSMSYDTGYQYVITGTNIQHDGNTISAPSVGAVSNFSDQVSTASGTAGDLAGTITTQGVMTITAGGAGTTATGQFVNELTVQ